MTLDIITFEIDNRYYMKYEVNGFTYSRRISFDLYTELDNANKLNELTTT